MTNTQVSDEKLLGDFVGGRRSALEELARRHEPHLLGLASGLLGGRDDLARDGVQETWVRVIRFGNRFNGRSSFKTWLYRIAVNQCQTLTSGMIATPSTSENAKKCSTAPSPQESAQIAERGAVLRRAVEQLGDDKRTILLLCYHQGLTHEQAAEILEIPIGTLKSRLSAALKELRERLPPEMYP